MPGYYELSLPRQPLVDICRLCEQATSSRAGSRLAVPFVQPREIPKSGLPIRPCRRGIDTTLAATAAIDPEKSQRLMRLAREALPPELAHLAGRCRLALDRRSA